MVHRLAREVGYSTGQGDRASREIKVNRKRDTFGKGSKVYWSTGKGIVSSLDELAKTLK